jgi:hypothetical protein
VNERPHHSRRLPAQSSLVGLLCGLHANVAVARLIL